jgi:HAE1 family hydrophobic/amphiphilic exporter-1
MSAASTRAALRFTTLMVFFATLALSVYLFVIIPKGLLPAAGHRPDHRHVEPAQDISFADMMKRQERSARSCRPIPTSPRGDGIGGSGSAPGNNGACSSR